MFPKLVSEDTNPRGGVTSFAFTCDQCLLRKEGTGVTRTSMKTLPRED